MKKRANQSSRILNQSEIIRHILVNAKLPSHPMCRIMHIPHPLISQIGQLSNIGGG